MKTLTGLVIIGYLALIIGIFGGWGLNLYKLLQCDFESPYKAEIIRVAGVPFAPIGIFAGWIDIDDTPKQTQQEEIKQ